MYGRHGAFIHPHSGGVANHGPKAFQVGKFLQCAEIDTRDGNSVIVTGREACELKAPAGAAFVQPPGIAGGERLRHEEY